MMHLTNILSEIHPVYRILFIVFLAVAAHFLVKAIRLFSQWLLTMKPAGKPSAEVSLVRRHPKAATVITLFVSAVTFSIYFLAVGMILREFKISLTAYFATATVIGLAVGFGLQGFVHDLVMGLTLIFSNALNMGEVVKLGDEIGHVEHMGLRFTTLMNIQGQRIMIPNRDIGVITHFREGCVRAYMDVQLPPKINESEILSEIMAIADGMYLQHRFIILSKPQNLGIREAENGRWRYLRMKIKFWPGQNKFIEETFKEGVLQVLKQFQPDYATWMITVIYGAE